MNATATKTAHLSTDKTAPKRPSLTLVKSPSLFDPALVAIGMKQATDEAPTSPLEWNGKVVGLTVSLLSCLAILAAVMFWAATLSADLKHLQEQVSQQFTERERLAMQRESQMIDLNKRLQAIEIEQRIQEARK